MTTPALVVIAARAGSTSLSDGPLAEVAGMAMLELQLRRLLPITTRSEAQLVVATSDLIADEPIADLAGRLGVAVVRGSETDVLGRFAIALVRHPAEVVAHVGANSPLADPFVIGAAIDLHRRVGADYTSNTLPRSYPLGLDVEVLSARSLRIAELEAEDPHDREQVTSYIVRRPGRFSLANLHSGHDLARERWAVDTPQDLARIREIVGQVPDPLTASWNRILAVTGRASKPRPGEVVLRPLDTTPAGAAPWVREWSVEVDGQALGTATVAAGDGVFERQVDVADRWVEPAREALYRLLLDDPQTRP